MAPPTPRLGPRRPLRPYPLGHGWVTRRSRYGAWRLLVSPRVRWWRSAVCRPVCSGSLVELVDLVGYEAVRFTMHRAGGFRVRRLDEAEDLARLLVDPVALVVDAVLVLRLDVLLMRLRDICGGDLATERVDVHVQRHDPPPCRGVTSMLWPSAWKMQDRWRRPPFADGGRTRRRPERPPRCRPCLPAGPRRRYLKRGRRFSVSACGLVVSASVRR